MTRYYTWVLSAELIGILAVGIALGGLQLTLWGMIRTDLRDLANRVGTLERRQARLEGLIEGAGLFPATDARQGESVPA